MSSVRVCLDVEAKGEGKVGYDQQVVVCSCSGKVEVHVSDARLLILQGDAASDIPNVVAGCIAESDQGGVSYGLRVRESCSDPFASSEYVQEDGILQLAASAAPIEALEVADAGEAWLLLTWVSGLSGCSASRWQVHWRQNADWMIVLCQMLPCNALDVRVHFDLQRELYGGRKSCTPGEWPANLPEIFEAASFAPASLSLRFGPRSYLSNNVSNCVFSWSGGTIPRHAKCRHWRTSALMAVGNGGRSNELCSPILGES
ncbi:Ankyrin repeat domain-containing protein 50 [Durusdinium trenchii]|uniref:Ankyrin repeat domain-containing protein 50 n=1 Tax=Durusdinium trenchii TaxID=1381693 RepID=A0ABP0IG00_9DINO